MLNGPIGSSSWPLWVDAKNGPLLSTRSDDDDDDVMLLIKVCVIPLTIVLSVKFSGMHENY